MSTNDTSPTLRITLLLAMVAVMLLALLSRLWFLQVLAGERYDALAKRNEVRDVILEAPRGRILAADGTELVKNRPALTVSADARALVDGNGDPIDETAEAILDQLSTLLQMPVEDIVSRLTSRRYSPLRPVPIREDVPPEVVFYIEENSEFFRGVVTERLHVRTYPQGELASHVVGYVREISEQELASERFADYRSGTIVGKAGLERSYEEDLQGEEGRRRLQVNARGLVLDVMSEVKPVPGDDLVTTVDADLQAETERILEEGILASRKIQRTDGRFLPSKAGAALVLDPRDGAVVAMASWPDYEPAMIVDGFTQRESDFLFKGIELDEPRDADGAVRDEEYEPIEAPAINRAVQGAYPPGSVFKVVSGAAALEAGLVAPSTRVPCPPAWNLGGITFRNWNVRNEGSLDLADALMRSCDTYFYELAWRQYQREEAALEEGSAEELLPEVAQQFGLGRLLGIDLPEGVEKAGVIPSREWKRDFWELTKEQNCTLADQATPGTYAKKLYTELCQEGYRFRGGDAVNSSIGQGDVLTTPLQMASAYAAIANGGTLWWPHLGREIRASDGSRVRAIEPRPLGTLELEAGELSAIQRGLEQVVMATRGTAAGAFRDFPLDEIPVAGKTGTAEYGSRVPYAWFASYAPADDPRYVVVVAVEEGGGGSQTAAPIARRILEAAFGLDPSPFEAGPANTD
jgi:penicillin-binding protein 2